MQNRRQETHTSIENCTNKSTTRHKGCKNNNTGIINKQDINSQSNPNNPNMSINYFYSLNNVGAEKRSSSAMIQSIHTSIGNVFNGIGCFKGTFSLQLKADSKICQALPRCVAYVLQKPFKEELKPLQEMDIIAPVGVDETSEWCNSFVLVSKANGKVRLCLDLTWLNQALIRPVHRGLTLNDIWPRLNNMQYMSVIDASSGYHNLKLHKQSSYLTTFSCLFGSYWYKHFLFGAALADNMIQYKIDEIFNDMPNVFGIADDILVLGYDKNGADHDKAVYSVLRQCQDVNLN